MKLMTVISLILPTFASLARQVSRPFCSPDAHANDNPNHRARQEYAHLRCQTVNKNTGKRDFSVGGDWTKHIVYDKDKLGLIGPTWIYQHHGLDCVNLVSHYDIDTFNQYCIQRCIPGKPQFVCMAVSSGCCTIKTSC